MNYVGKRVALSVERGLFYVHLPLLMLYVWREPGQTVTLWRVGGWVGGRGQ